VTSNALEKKTFEFDKLHDQAVEEKKRLLAVVDKIELEIEQKREQIFALEMDNRDLNERHFQFSRESEHRIKSLEGEIDHLSENNRLKDIEVPLF
jgi:FtsZ-binding cell division protein ZapB